ncbi:hypothetical protein U1Q18_022947, partial [Sarracenia purpurea var. burkii]
VHHGAYLSLAVFNCLASSRNFVGYFFSPSRWAFFFPAAAVVIPFLCNFCFPWRLGVAVFDDSSSSDPDVFSLASVLEGKGGGSLVLCFSMRLVGWIFR